MVTDEDRHWYLEQTFDPDFDVEVLKEHREARWFVGIDELGGKDSGTE